MIFSTLLLSLVTSVSAQANSENTCDQLQGQYLSDIANLPTYNGIESVSLEKFTNLTQKSTFSRDQKNQIKYAANELLNKDYTYWRRGVAGLVEQSEGGDVYLDQFQFNSESYTAVYYYPGGNKVGVLYAGSGEIVIARIGDDEVSCVLFDDQAEKVSGCLSKVQETITAEDAASEDFDIESVIANDCAEIASDLDGNAIAIDEVGEEEVSAAVALARAPGSQCFNVSWMAPSNSGSSVVVVSDATTCEIKHNIVTWSEE